MKIFCETKEYLKLFHNFFKHKLNQDWVLNIIFQKELCLSQFLDGLVCYYCLHFEYDNADGLIWVSEWNALQHPVASAFLAVIYSDYMLSSRTAQISCSGSSFKPADLRKFAISQVCVCTL